ncbi:MAG: glycosyltransferase family 2 protein [bacterium]
MSPELDLTVIVASFETRARTLACLASIARATAFAAGRAIETIVIDNGSLDGSPAAIARSHPGVRLFALVRNRGFAAAVNLGLRSRRGRHVLLLNSDVEIEPDLLEEGLRLLDERAEIGVLGGSLRHPDGRLQRSVHPLPDAASELLPGPLLRRLRPGAGLSRSRSSRAVDRGRLIEAEAVRGAVFFMRGELLETVGLLDESFFFFLEETDYCRRVREAGHGVFHAPQLSAMHRLGASSKRRAPLATRVEYHRSLYRYLARHHGRGVMRLVQVVRASRTALAFPLLLTAAPFSTRIRGRLAERWGLLLWHLRGLPAEPRFAEALRVGSGGGSGAGPEEEPA